MMPTRQLHPPLGQTARRWIAIVFSAGTVLLVVLAWMLWRHRHPESPEAVPEIAEHDRPPGLAPAAPAVLSMPRLTENPTLARPARPPILVAVPQPDAKLARPAETEAVALPPFEPAGGVRPDITGQVRHLQKSLQLFRTQQENAAATPSPR